MRFIYILMLLVSVHSFAQIQTNVTVETLSGYENNIFKSPKTFRNNAGVTLGKDSLYTNSFYQDLGVRAVFKKPWKKQSLSLRINPRGRYYYSENDASYFTLYSGLSYVNKISRKTDWFASARFNIRDREGENVDGSELRFPLGYRFYDITAGTNFRMYRQNRTYAKVFYGNKDYNETDRSDLAYDFVGANTIIRNVFRRPAGYHSYGVELNYVHKFFTNSKNASGAVNEKFTWRDFSSELFYRYPVTEQWQLRFSVAYKGRNDSEKKFTYGQYKPALSIRYKTTDLLLNLTGNYVSRTYKTLRATASDNSDLGKLKYQYYQLRLEGELKLNKKLSIITNSFLNTRDSNKTNINSIYFRSYKTFYAGLGIRYRF